MCAFAKILQPILCLILVFYYFVLLSWSLIPTRFTYEKKTVCFVIFSLNVHIVIQDTCAVLHFHHLRNLVLSGCLILNIYYHFKNLLFQKKIDIQ